MKRTISKRVFWGIAAVAVAAVVLTLGHAVANNDNGTDVVQFKSDGKTLYFYQYVAGSHYYYFRVTETKSSSSTTGDTRTAYGYVYEYDYSTSPATIVRQIYGEIPAGDFTVGGTSASVATDTADWTVTSRYPATAPDIAVDLTWTENGTYSYSQNGHTKYSQISGDYEYRYVTNGQQDYFYADVEGTWGDEDIELVGTTTAYVLDNKNVQHTISKHVK